MQCKMYTCIPMYTMSNVQHNSRAANRRIGDVIQCYAEHSPQISQVRAVSQPLLAQMFHALGPNIVPFQSVCISKKYTTYKIHTQSKW